MSTLSIAKVAKAAPAAAAPRTPDRDKLIDSTQFLRYCGVQYGFSPVIAVQGTPHRDAETIPARSGRHLVVASNGRGVGFVLLNSHFKDRRAHIGLCLLDRTDMLVAKSMPVQRWKGFEDTLRIMDDRRADLRLAEDALKSWVPSTATLTAMAADMSRECYLANAVLHPTPESLVEGFEGNALDFAFHVVRKMKAGRLPSTTPDAYRVRAIRRPDTLFNAGMMAFSIVLEKGREMGRVSTRILLRVQDRERVRP